MADKETFGSVEEKGSLRVAEDCCYKLLICKPVFILFSKTHSEQILLCFVSGLPLSGFSWTPSEARSAEAELKKLRDEAQPLSGNILA